MVKGKQQDLLEVYNFVLTNMCSENATIAEMVYFEAEFQCHCKENNLATPKQLIFWTPIPDCKKCGKKSQKLLKTPPCFLTVGQMINAGHFH